MPITVAIEKEMKRLRDRREEESLQRRDALIKLKIVDPDKISEAMKYVRLSTAPIRRALAVADVIPTNQSNFLDRYNQAKDGDTLDIMDRVTINSQLNINKQIKFTSSNKLGAIFTKSPGTGSNGWIDKKEFLLIINAPNVSFDGLELDHNVGGMYLESTAKEFNYLNNRTRHGGSGNYYNRHAIYAGGGCPGIDIIGNYFHDSWTKRESGGGYSGDRNLEIWGPSGGRYNNNFFYQVSDGGHIEGVYKDFQFVGNRFKRCRRMCLESQDHTATDSNYCQDCLYSKNIAWEWIFVYGESWFLSIMPQRGHNIQVLDNYCNFSALDFDPNGSRIGGYMYELGWRSGLAARNICAGKNYRGAFVVSMPNTKLVDNFVYGKPEWFDYTGEGGLDGGGGTIDGTNNQTIADLSKVPALPGGDNLPLTGTIPPIDPVDSKTLKVILTGNDKGEITFNFENAIFPVGVDYGSLALTKNNQVIGNLPTGQLLTFHFVDSDLKKGMASITLPNPQTGIKPTITVTNVMDHSVDLIVNNIPTNVKKVELAFSSDQATPVNLGMLSFPLTNIVNNILRVSVENLPNGWNNKVNLRLDGVVSASAKFKTTGGPGPWPWTGGFVKVKPISSDPIIEKLIITNQVTSLVRILWSASTADAIKVFVNSKEQIANSLISFTFEAVKGSKHTIQVMAYKAGKLIAQSDTIEVTA